MYYIYILKCVDGVTYTGCTGDLKARIDRHRRGQVPATAKRLPVELVSYIAVHNKHKAFELEKYFKSGSGRAFTKRHLL